MDTPRLTDERLRFGLNGDQPSRERLCLGVLALDRSYSVIKPRRPEGGPDGGRDIECLRLGEPCFGAVGFKNGVSDSPADKKDIRDKFKDDVQSARAANEDLKQFVFFCNVDLTPTEVKKLAEFANSKGFTHVDIYWRERIRIALDSAEGLALRFQHLGIALSEAEQAAFFSRFGKELEDLVRGKFDRIEKKLDDIEFQRWKAGHFRSMSLSIEFKELVESKQAEAEHFRVALVLHALAHESERDIVLGGRDDYSPAGDGKHYFAEKTFFHLKRLGPIEKSWVQHKGARCLGGLVSGMSFGVRWRPHSPVMVSELENLHPSLVITKNLADRIKRVSFKIDDYLFKDYDFSPGRLKTSRPGFDWPDPLTDAEEKLEYVCDDWWRLHLDSPPPKTDGNARVTNSFG